jgi:hypothetical protein
MQVSIVPYVTKNIMEVGRWEKDRRATVPINGTTVKIEGSTAVCYYRSQESTIDSVQ